MENWKRIALKAGAFGGGFAVVAAVILGGAIWWSSRPPKPKPWDRHSITAAFTGATASTHTDGFFTYEYVLQNNTDADYTLEQKLSVMKKDSNDALSEIEVWTPQKTFVPAHQKTAFKIVVPYKSRFGDRTPDPDGAKEIEFLNEQKKTFKGFVVFDSESKTEIDFPPMPVGQK